jgi:hypothetical protein
LSGGLSATLDYDLALPGGVFLSPGAPHAYTTEEQWPGEMCESL